MLIEGWTGLSALAKVSESHIYSSVYTINKYPICFKPPITLCAIYTSNDGSNGTFGVDPILRLQESDSIAIELEVY